jgi:hypothetical protein
MRIDNLPIRDIERVKSGDIRYLTVLLDAELEYIKEDLISLPVSKVEELRGKAKAIKAILKLLP